MRLALFTEIIAPYRVPVFNELAQYPEIELKVFFCSETEHKRDWAIAYDQIQFKYKVMRKFVRRFQHPHGSGELYLNPSVLIDLYRFNPDVIITGGYHQPTYWLVIVYARLFRKKLVLWSESSDHDTRSNNRLKEAYKRVLVHSYNRFTVPGNSQQRYLKQLGVNESEITFTPNAIDTSFFLHSALKAKANKAFLKHELGIFTDIVLFVGRLTVLKGIGDLIKAMAHIAKEKRPTLLLVGDGPDRKHFEALAQDLDIATLFVGSKRQEELPTYYGIADIFAFPTHADVWGLVLNEAIACGLPVVASSVAGATEDLVKDGWNGFVHAPGNYQEIGRAIEKLAENPELRCKMGENSLEKSASYSPTQCAEGLATAALEARR
jgi:glycosyltransferase involved in cell wall biosynthesis